METPKYINSEVLNNFINSALKEDIAEGDHSSLACIPKEAIRKAHLLIKDNGILAGVDLAKTIFNTMEIKPNLEIFIEDGTEVKYGEIAFIIEGKAQEILKLERLVLNCMQRMSGIATYTNYLNSLIKHTKAQLLDTRKTTPNFRIIEKWGVFIGGGVNHRMGLYDQIMLKDNHIAYAGGITEAVKATKEYLTKNKKDLKIEVEVQSLKEVEEILKTGGVDIIMLDNMSVEAMTEAVKFISGKAVIEASGGITEETITSVAETGVDYISVGALTHSVKSLDMSLKAID